MNLFDLFRELALECADDKCDKCGAAENNCTDEETTLKINGEEMDLSKPENVEKACALIDAFTSITNNPVLNLLFDKEEFEAMAADTKKKLHNNLLEEPEEEESEEDDDNDDLYEVDSEYIANAYLEENVPGYETLDTAQKDRIVARLADFLEWFNTQWVDDDGCDCDNCEHCKTC